MKGMRWTKRRETMPSVPNVVATAALSGEGPNSMRLAGSK